MAVQIHACILSPLSCRFITLPHHGHTAQPAEDEKLEAEAEPAVPPYDPATTLVLYPSPSAVPLSDPSIAHLLPNVRTVVVIESTWQKGGAVYSHPQLALNRLQAVRLSEYESTYWRYQELGRHALCTLEAIYHLCRELVALEDQRGGTHRRDAMGGTQLDDLLYLYAAQHSRLQTRYGEQQNNNTQSDEEETHTRSAQDSVLHATHALSAASCAHRAELQPLPASERQKGKKPPPRAVEAHVVSPSYRTVAV